MKKLMILEALLRGGFLILFIVLLSPAIFAQRPAGSVGIGAQFGQPTGLTVKIYRPAGVSWDFLAAWDLDDFYFLNVHGLFERHIGQSGRVHYFVGPGLFMGLTGTGKGVDFDGGSNEFSAGLSGTIGLNVILDRIELFGQLTPRLKLIHETAGDLGGGGGIRFYF